MKSRAINIAKKATSAMVESKIVAKITPVVASPLPLYASGFSRSALRKRFAAISARMGAITAIKMYKSGNKGATVVINLRKKDKTNGPIPRKKAAIAAG